MGPLVNTLGPNDRYPVLNRDNLTIPIQMQLSKKKKSFSQFVATFSKSGLNFEHFERKDDSHGFYISEMTNFENLLRYLS